MSYARKNRLGIGKKLLVEFKKKVKIKRTNRISLTTDEDAYENVLHFYEISGYKVFFIILKHIRIEKWLN